MTTAKKDLTTGSVYSHLFFMALPMFIGTSAHLILNLADGMYVSHLGTREAMAVLNYGFPLFYVPFALFNGLNQGASAVLAQLIGKKNKTLAENTLGQMLWISLGIFLLLMLLFPLILPLYLGALKVDTITSGFTRSYLIALLPGIGLLSVAMILGAGLRAEGNMRALMNAMLLGTLCNLVLDPFLIFGEFSVFSLNFKGAGLGVVGAALATSVSNFITLTVILRYYLKRKTILKFSSKPSWSDRSGTANVFKVGTPAILSQSMLAFSTLSVTYLATPFGEAAIAAMGIGSRLDIIAVFPSLSIMTAVVSLVGQNYGAKNYERTGESILKGLGTAFFSLAIFGSLVWVFRGSLISLFSPAESVRLSAEHYLGCSSLSYGFIGLAMVSGGAFQGLGRGWPSLWITTFRLFLFNFLLGFTLSRFTTFGERGIHYAPMISNALLGTLAAIWITRMVKSLNTIARTE